MQKYLEAAGVKFQFNTRVDNVDLNLKMAKRLLKRLFAL